jgi:hypothetical protein
MSVQHITLDVLSAYLDRELEGAEAGDVARHVEGCTECKAQLDGLRAVALGLRDVDRLAPPPLLAQSIRRQLELVDRQLPAWKQPRLVGKLNSNLLLLFAMVIALAIVVVQFGDALKRLENRGSTLVAPAGGTFREEFRPHEQASSVQLGDRTFDLNGSTWVERGLPEAERWLQLEEARRVLRGLPELLALVAGDGSAREVHMRLRPFGAEETDETGESVAISAATVAQVAGEEGVQPGD